MAISEIDELMDKMLRDVYYTEAKSVGFGYLKDPNGFTYDQQRGSRVARALTDEGLIRWTGYPNADGGADMIYIERKGEKIQESGGWLVYLERQKNDQAKYHETKAPNKKDSIATLINALSTQFWVQVAAAIVGGLLLAAIILIIKRFN